MKHNQLNINGLGYFILGYFDDEKSQSFLHELFVKGVDPHYAINTSELLYKTVKV